MSRTGKPSRATPCVVCEIELDHFTNARRIPDYLCSTCFVTYQDQLDEPWMKFLQNQERYRRMKRQRRVRAGILMEEISLDQLAEAGYTVPHTVIKENYERPKPTRRTA